MLNLDSSSSRFIAYQETVKKTVKTVQTEPSNVNYHLRMNGSNDT